MASPQAEIPCSGQQLYSSLQKLWNAQTSSSSAAFQPKLPQTSPSRLASTSNEKTILYLAYGSNLSAQTFLGNRGIKPLSAVNAHIPSLSLTFDLPGIPYIEPCFANTRYRDTNPSPPTNDDYHKDRWHKGLVGVVYEVTPEDYRTIIATEGGGASYQDVVVLCYTLPAGLKTVDPEPKGSPFMAHTLFSPRSSDNGRLQRPDPSYAQASARYMKLITDGGEEHSLPADYMAFLYNIRSYTITTYRQKAGQALFLAVWSPFLLAILALGQMVADGDGKVPVWFAKVTAWIFIGMWGSYDRVYKKAFGDGERTVGDTDEDGDEEMGVGKQWGEKGEIVLQLPS
ncbi:Gamma-glutamyl cyclotransferase [Lachnellula willkommii]|uniref:gamma-glutamylcyclotransferase n=1 Tax=Lachnellula willkommii TaxID=215461 RepID=A0A559M2H3_9HELO|nr:Gamma-glutamyl cyclotransferase [Lachnellula willkommii]